MTGPKGGRQVEVEDVMAALAREGVRHGIKKDVIENIVMQQWYNEKVVVAEGEPAEDGQNGKVSYLFETEGSGPRPTIDEEGDVNFYELNLIQNVRIGDPLAEKMPPTPGKNGANVFGDPIPAKPGKDFWTHYPIVAGTWFFDPERTWSASFLSRYEFHGKRKDVDVTPGHDVSVELGLGKRFGMLTVGVSGYGQWQVSNDKGAGVGADAGVHDRVFGFGPEIQRFFPEYGFGFQLRHWREFGAKDRSDGSITTLTLVKPF